MRIIPTTEHVKTYLFQMLITNSQKGAYGSSPHQHITQPMETLLTKYTNVGFCIYVKFQFIDSYNIVCTISNCFSCRRHIQWFWLPYLFPSIFPFNNNLLFGILFVMANFLLCSTCLLCDMYDDLGRWRGCIQCGQSIVCLRLFRGHTCMFLTMYIYWFWPLVYYTINWLMY